MQLPPFFRIRTEGNRQRSKVIDSSRFGLIGPILSGHGKFKIGTERSGTFKKNVNRTGSGCPNSPNSPDSPNSPVPIPLVPIPKFRNSEIQFRNSGGHPIRNAA